MRGTDTSLRKRGLYLIAVPAVLQVLIVGVLTVSLLLARQDYAAESKSKEVLRKASGVGNLVAESLAMFGLSKEATGSYHETVDSKDVEVIDRSLDELAQMTSYDSEQRENAGKAKAAFHEMLKVYQASPEVLNAEQNKRRDEIEATFERRLVQFLTPLAEIVEREKARASHKGQLREEWRQRMAWLVAGWLVMSGVIAAISARVYAGGIIEPVRRLADNSIKIALRQPLPAPLKSADELSALDGILHEVDRLIEEASVKERALFENSVDVICSVDGEGFFTGVNRASIKRLGFEPGQMISHPVAEFVIADDVHLCTEELERACQSEQERLFELRMRKHNHERADTLWSTYWSRREESLFCVIHDITQRKEQERMRKEFVAMISHDLRTPLTSVLTSVSLLSEEAYGELPPTATQELQDIDRNLERLIGLVNDLLDFEKLQSGSYGIVNQECSLQSVLADSILAVEVLAKARQLRFVLPDRDVRANVDRDRIMQVLINLLANAIDFSPEGSQITIALDGPDDGFVKVEVSDEGPGVPAQFQQLIFDPYQQVHAELNATRHSTGLGLPICKMIVEAHGGRAGVRSLEGTTGSTFWFTLPA